MNPQSTTTTPANGDSTAQDLFALTDEQILEIDEGGASATPPVVILSEEKNLSSGFTSGNEQAKRDSSVATLPQNDRVGGSETPRDSQQATEPQAQSRATEHGSQDTKHDAAPPKWLADRMADPRSGAEARELWIGIQQARQEAAAFREVFAKPEEARAAAERARTLDEMDAAFYGGAGKSPQEISAARAALAQRMMREDPAAFREMVFAGLRALEGQATEAQRHREEPRGAASVSPPPDSAVGATLGSPAGPRGIETGGASLPRQANSTMETAAASVVGAQHAAPLLGSASVPEAQITAYRAFERTANEELERSVGGAIDRALAQALPNARRENGQTAVGARHAVPLQERLSSAIRQDIESALKGDRQLGEQIAQLLAARRFDDTTRSQVVRLINDRAQQLVPSAAKRVINDWTQTTLAAHRAKTQKTESGATHAGLAQAERGGEIPPSRSGNTARSTGSFDSARDMRNDSAGGTTARIDYRKLSDEQILEL